MTLVLEAGDEALNGFLSGPMKMTQFSGFAVGLATALGGLHERELIAGSALGSRRWVWFSVLLLFGGEPTGARRLTFCGSEQEV
jgi:hypothetical protein